MPIFLPEYTFDMSPLRRTLSIVGLIILAASLVVLALSLWPTERKSDRQTLPSDDLSLPTPESPLPILFMGAVLSPQRSRRPQRRKIGALIMIAAILLAACGGGAPTASPTEIDTTVEPVPTFVVELTREPTNLPQTATAPPAFIPTSMPRPPESRAVEVEYPVKLRVGDSDVVRLALVVSTDGTYLTPTAESGGAAVIGEPVKIPNLYDTHTLTAVARFDSVGLSIDRAGDWEQPVLPGENVTWRWTIAADDPGRQRANLIIYLHFVPKSDGEILEKELWARTLTIETTTVFGLSGPAAQAFGAVGGIVGFVLGFPFADNVLLWLWKKITGKPQKRK